MGAREVFETSYPADVVDVVVQFRSLIQRLGAIPMVSDYRDVAIERLVDAMDAFINARVAWVQQKAVEAVLTATEAVSRTETLMQEYLESKKKVMNNV